MKSERQHLLTDAATGSSLNHSSSLMTNYESGKVAAPGKQVFAVADKGGNPIILTVSADEGDSPSALYMTYRDSSVSTGWKQVCLTDTLPAKGLHTQAIALTQFSDGTITLAVAAATALKGPSKLYLATGLSDDPQTSPWASHPDAWRARPTPKKLGSLVIKKISLSDSASGIPADDNGPLMFVSDESGGDYYIVSTGNPAPAEWPLVTAPDGDPKNVIQMLSGNHVSNGAGIYSLYDRNQGKEVAFQGAPNSNPFGAPADFTLSVVPRDIQRISLGIGNAGMNSLYATDAKGLQYFAPDILKGNATGAAVLSTDMFNSAKALAVTEGSADDGALTVWAIDADSNLIYATGNKSDPTKAWNGPFVFKHGVAQIAAVQNHARGHSEIVLVGLDGKLAYLWKDPTTTLWTESDIPLYTTKETLSFQCYTTALHLHDKSGTGVKAKIKLTASSTAYVTINGEPYVLTPNHAVTVDTNSSGQITIIQKVSSLAVSNYIINSDALTGPIEIKPSAAVQSALGKIKSADDLRHAKNQNTGAPIFTGTPKIGYADAAKAINSLTSLSPAPQDANGKLTSLGMATSPNAFTTAIDPSAHTKTWALVKTADDQVKHIEGAEADAHLASLAELADIGSILDDITADAGDALRWMDQAEKDVTSFVATAAKDTVHFVIKVDNDVVRFVVKTAEQVYAAVSYVLKQIGAALDKLIEWVGFLFDWDGIKTTKNALKAYTLKGLEFLTAELGDAETEVEKYFDGLKCKVHNALNLSAGAIAGAPTGSIVSTVQGQGQNAHEMKTPGGGFSAYHVQHSGMLSGDSGGGMDIGAELLSWISGLVNTELDSIEGDVTKAVKQFADRYQKQKLTLEDVLKFLVEVAANIALDTVKNIAVGALQFGELLLGEITKLLTAPIPIPFLSALYKDITCHDLTLLDALSLLLAIPGTLVFKTAADKAPFTDTDVEAIKKADPQKLFSALAKPKKLTTAPMLLDALESEEASESGPPALEVYSAIGAIIGGIGGMIAMLCRTIETETEDSLPLVPKFKLGFSLLSTFMSLPLGSGDAERYWEWGDWYLSAGQKLLGTTAISNGEQEVADKFVAGVDTVGGVIAAVLQIGGLVAITTADGESETPDWVGFSAGLLMDVSDFTGGIADLDPDPVTKEVLVITSTASGGIGSLAIIGNGVKNAALLNKK